MFGYAFDSHPTPDRVDHRAAPYRHPHSFYLPGMPYLPQMPLSNAPNRPPGLKVGSALA
jgi:hypothetical protein